MMQTKQSFHWSFCEVRMWVAGRQMSSEAQKRALIWASLGRLQIPEWISFLERVKYDAHTVQASIEWRKRLQGVFYRENYQIRASSGKTHHSKLCHWLWCVTNQRAGRLRPGFNITNHRRRQDVARSAEYLAVFVSIHLLGYAGCCKLASGCESLLKVHMAQWESPKLSVPWATTVILTKKINSTHNALRTALTKDTLNKHYHPYPLLSTTE